MLVVEQKAYGALEALTLSSQDCLVYRRAVAAVKLTDRPLDLAAHDDAEGVKLLGPDSRVEAVEFSLANRGKRVVQFLPPFP